MSSSSDVLSTAHVWSFKVCDWAMHGWAIPHLQAPNEGRSQLAPGRRREGLPACRLVQGLPAEEIVWGRAAAGTYPFCVFCSVVRSVMSSRGRIHCGTLALCVLQWPEFD